MFKRLLKLLIKLTIGIIIILLLLLLLLFWFPQTSWFDRLTAGDLYKTLNSEQWVEYQNNNLGISFSKPYSWKMPPVGWVVTVEVPYVCNLATSDLTSKNLIALGDDGYHYIVFCKDPSLNALNHLQILNEAYDINGIKFAIYSSKPGIPIVNNEIGDILFSKDLNIAIVAVTYHVDDGSSTRALHDEIFLKIIKSIKRQGSV